MVHTSERRIKNPRALRFHCLAIAASLFVASATALAIGAPGAPNSATPTDYSSHYNIPSQYTGKGQSIVILASNLSYKLKYDSNLGIPADTQKYMKALGLPACTSASCYDLIDLIPSPQLLVNGKAVDDIAARTAVELIRGTAPQAHIYLIDMGTNGQAAAVAKIRAIAPIAVLMTWSTPEFAGQQSTDVNCLCDGFFRAHPEIAFISSSGASSVALYPSTSPYVTAVGVTNWNPSANTEVEYQGAAPLSSFERIPGYQASFDARGTQWGAATSGSMRSQADVGVNGTYPVTTIEAGYLTTESGSQTTGPVWAGIVALMGEAFTTNGKSLPALLASSNGMNNLLYSQAWNSVFGSPGGAGRYSITGGVGHPNVGQMITTALATVAPKPTYGGYGSAGKNGYQSYNGGWIQTQTPPAHVSGYDDFYFACDSTYSCTLSNSGTDLAAALALPAGSGSSGGAQAHLRYDFAQATNDFRWVIQQDTPVAPVPSYGGYGTSGKNGYLSYDGGWIQTQTPPAHVSGYDDFYFACNSTYACTLSNSGTDAAAAMPLSGGGGLGYLHWGYSPVTGDIRWRVVAH